LVPSTYQILSRKLQKVYSPAQSWFYINVTTKFCNCSHANASTQVISNCKINQGNNIKLTVFNWPCIKSTSCWLDMQSLDT
jgi:hypothetical protein